MEGIRKGCVAVFGSPDAVSGTERLVVLAEARPRAATAVPRLRDAVARAVIATIGEPPDEVVLAPPHTVLKTSSGKIRRAACRALYERGGAHLGAAPVHRQLLRLVAGAARLRLRRIAGTMSTVLFAGYAIVLFWLLAPATWLLAVTQSSPARVWTICRAAARALFALTRMMPRVEGLENLPAGACVLVSNHGSYLDGVVLVAALSRPCVFVAKAELRQQRIAGPFLRRLGAVFVERFDLRRAVEDAEAMRTLAQRGEVLLVFPEGTFSAAPGLLPFRLGAFLAAAQAEVPVVPMVLGGHRTALPDGSWWPRRARLEVHVLPPVPQPSGGDLFARAVRLRDAAYGAIAARVET